MFVPGVGSHRDLSGLLAGSVQSLQQNRAEKELTGENASLVKWPRALEGDALEVCANG